MEAEAFDGLIALRLEGTEESAHMGSPDFRVGGRIFAALASQTQGYGNPMLTPRAAGSVRGGAARGFRSHRGWMGKDGNDSYSAAAAEEDVLAGALRVAWKLRLEKDARSGKKTRRPRYAQRRKR